jgi:hypothetical protein
MNYPEFSEKGEVICQECGVGYKVMTGSHTRRKHGMSIEEYKAKYPGAPTSGKMFSLTMSQVQSKTEMFEEKPVKVEVDLHETGEDDVITDEGLEDEDAPTIEEIQEKIQDEDMSDLFQFGEVQDPEPFNTIDEDDKSPKDKLQLLKFLRKKYPFTQNNFMIKKFLLTGHLEYEFITDMADPINKIDFEFPNAFWHNRMPFDDPQRTLKLRRDGWKVITIGARAPKVADVEKLIST